jgi:serine phosphatase RsbU (regulator of sigma subunit)
MEGATPTAPDAGIPPGEPAEGSLSAFAAAALELVRSGRPERGLRDLVRAVALATGAELVVARVADDDRDLITRAVYAPSQALTAELEGTRVPAAELGDQEAALANAPGDPTAPAALRRIAALAGAPIVRLVPVAVDGELVAALELYRSGLPFGPEEEALARAAAAHLALAARLERAGAGPNGRVELSDAQLELLGEALAAGADEAEAAEQIVRVAVEAAEADWATLWRLDPEAAPAFLASHGLEHAPDLEAARRLPAALEKRGDAPDRDGPWLVYTVSLGEPPAAALQLGFDGRDEGGPVPDLERLTPFTAGAALALRRGRRVGLIALALKRSQTLVAVVSQAIAQLSLAHTLETAVERVAELTASGHVALYLQEGDRLAAAASRGLGGRHTDLAERLLELALGPFRGRGFLFIEDMRRDRRLAGLEDVLEESAIRRALFIPLLVHDEVIGALGVFKTRARPYRDGEEGLLIALSSQLAVAVQNARLHERTKELSAILERTLESERLAARQLRGLYAISQSFAESLSLDATLEAVARTMVELLDVDVAVIRMPDERNEALTTRAVHVADPRVGEVVGALVSHPQPLSGRLARRLHRTRQAVVLTPGAAEDELRILEPFLRQGATAAVLPLATPGEMLGTLTLMSLDPGKPLEKDAVDTALAVGSQAALAIDNARLSQQQKDFAETMQRSLLPREVPQAPGLEVGHVYQSSARVDVGGDLYDFVSLEGGRLAVVIGDVLGKGISAAADMAMTKFSFRVLARSDPDPAAFLARANEVVCDEIEPGKFVTLLYVLVEPDGREVACGSAGHPPARVVDPGGLVTPLGKCGLALGIEEGQSYEAERVRLQAGSVVVLYTDGVLEARRGGELYGEERLDRLLASRRDLPAQELAAAILADCRAFAGELGDDCAIVCLKLAR